MKYKYWTTNRKNRFFAWVQGMLFMGSLVLAVKGDQGFWVVVPLSLLAGACYVFLMD